MAEIVTDDFNRADSATLGANWTKLTAANDIRITSNHAHGGMVAASNWDRYTGAGWTGSSTDHYAEVLVGALPGGSDGGPTARTSSVDDGYLLTLTDSNSKIFSIVDDVTTEVASGSTVPAVGETWRLEVVGTNLTAKRNGATEYGITDSAVASGIPGMFTYNNGTTFNSWAAGDFGASGLSVLIGEPLIGSSIF